MEFNGQFTNEVYEQLAKQQAERKKTELAIHGLTFRKGKQIVSHSAGVNPKQAEEATRMAALAGVPTHFGADGLPVFTSYKHRDKFLKAKGWTVYDRE